MAAVRLNPTRGSIHCPKQFGAASDIWRTFPTAFMAVFAIWFAYVHASPLPYGDEYEMVEVLTGDSSLSLQYLFSSHNEHRIPVPRLLLHLLLPIFFYDFRLLAASVPATVALGLTVWLTAVRTSGRRLDWSDNGLPFLLLSVGHAENFVWGWQLAYAMHLALCLAIAGTVVVGLSCRWSARRLVSTASILITLLCGCGGNGLLTALALLPALALVFHQYFGVKASFSFALYGGLLLSAGLISSVGSGGKSPEINQFATGLICFQANAIGPVAGSSPMFWGSIAALGFTALLAIALRRTWQSADPIAAIALGFLGACLLLGLAVAWTRTTVSPLEALQPRYFLLASVWAIAATLLVTPVGRRSINEDSSDHQRPVDEIEHARRSPSDINQNLKDAVHSPNRKYQQLGKWLVAAAATVIGFSNWPFGINYADAYRSRVDEIVSDVEGGLPLRLLSEKHYAHPFGLYNPDPDLLYSRLNSMRQHGLGIARLANPSPPTLRLTADDESFAWDPSTGRLTATRSIQLHGLTWRWSLARPSLDPRMAVAVFSPKNVFQPVAGGLARLGPVPARAALATDTPFGSLTFQGFDPATAARIANLTLFVEVSDP